MADECPKCPPVGAPLWLATFADMMSLLMCFFILLLSMATMDLKKFKQLAGSMDHAFGVQMDVPVFDVPMGTSVIAQDFSPAPAEQTPLEEVKQSTTQQSESLADKKVEIEKIMAKSLDASDISDADKKEVMQTLAQALESVLSQQMDKENMDKMKEELLKERLQAVNDQTEKFKEEFKAEIDEGLVTIERDGLKIIIRINEKGSFPSGSAVLKAGFEPVMNKITDSVNGAVGQVHIAGHTDNIPISTSAYRSNWELSSSRAVTIAQFMLEHSNTDPARLVIEGFADTQPLVSNDSAENRAKNRRVEVRLIQDDPTKDSELSKNTDKTVSIDNFTTSDAASSPSTEVKTQ